VNFCKPTTRENLFGKLVVRLCFQNESQIKDVILHALVVVIKALSSGIAINVSVKGYFKILRRSIEAVLRPRHPRQGIVVTLKDFPHDVIELAFFNVNKTGDSLYSIENRRVAIATA